MAGAHGDVVMTYAAGDLQRGATEQATAADSGPRQRADRGQHRGGAVRRPDLPAAVRALLSGNGESMEEVARVMDVVAAELGPLADRRDQRDHRATQRVHVPEPPDPDSARGRHRRSHLPEPGGAGRAGPRGRRPAPRRRLRPAAVVADRLPRRSRLLGPCARAAAGRRDPDHPARPARRHGRDLPALRRAGPPAGGRARAHGDGGTVRPRDEGAASAGRPGEPDHPSCSGCWATPARPRPSGRRSRPSCPGRGTPNWPNGSRGSSPRSTTTRTRSTSPTTSRHSGRPPADPPRPELCGRPGHVYSRQLIVGTISVDQLCAESG